MVCQHYFPRDKPKLSICISWPFDHFPPLIETQMNRIINVFIIRFFLFCTSSCPKHLADIQMTNKKSIQYYYNASKKVNKYKSRVVIWCSVIPWEVTSCTCTYYTITHSITTSNHQMKMQKCFKLLEFRFFWVTINPNFLTSVCFVSC